MSTPSLSDGSQVLRVNRQQELLAFIPHALGFYPRDSVVLVSVRAPRGRLGMVARVDLADVLGPHGVTLGEQLAEHLVADGAESVALVIYLGADTAEGAESPEVFRVLQVFDSVVELPPALDAWVVGTDWYRCVTCDNEECCPPWGRPLSELAETSVAAAFVMAGSAPAADRAQLAPGRDEDKRRRASFRRALTAQRRRQDAGEWSALAAVRRSHEVLTGNRPASPPELARLAHTLEGVQTRDACLAWLLEPGADRIDPGWLDEVFERAYSPRAQAPARPMLDTATTALTAAARLARGPLRGEVLAVLAWLRWWGGDGAGASVVAQEADDLVPGQRLASLVLRALDGGLAPSWARGNSPRSTRDARASVG